METKIYRIIRINKKKKKNLRITRHPYVSTRTYCTIQYPVLCNTSVQNILSNIVTCKSPSEYFQLPPQYQFRSTFFFIQFSRSFWFRGVDGSFPDSKINCVDTRIAFVTSNCRPIRHCILITRYYTSNWTDTVIYIYIFEEDWSRDFLFTNFELTCIDFV